MKDLNQAQEEVTTMYLTRADRTGLSVMDLKSIAQIYGWHAGEYQAFVMETLYLRDDWAYYRKRMYHRPALHAIMWDKTVADMTDEQLRNILAERATLGNTEVPGSEGEGA